MRFTKLRTKNKVYNIESKIEEILYDNKFYWLIDSEIENADITLENNTIIWNSGDFYNGNWYYGIWKGGNFYGVWENGIFESGNFKGNFLSGIKS